MDAKPWHVTEVVVVRGGRRALWENGTVMGRGLRHTSALCLGRLSLCNSVVLCPC